MKGLAAAPLLIYVACLLPPFAIHAPKTLSSSDARENFPRVVKSLAKRRRRPRLELGGSLREREREQAQAMLEK